MIELKFLKKTDVHETSESKKCDICHYCYFLHKGFKLQPNVCNRCHDLLMMTMNLSDIAILNIKSADYCCIIAVLLLYCCSQEKLGLLPASIFKRV